MVPECRHIKTSGGKCGSPALRGQPYCYFHSRLKERAAQSNFFRTTPLSKELSNLEDRAAIQHAITHVAMAASDRHIDTKLAGILLYALQIASGNAKNSEQIVATNAIAELTRTEQGEEMAPEGATSQPPEEEESLLGLLKKEVKRLHEEGKELNQDFFAEPIENNELTRKSQGRGEACAGKSEVRDESSAEFAHEPELLDEFGHPAPRWD
jgi:hypothetical protein